MHLYYHTRALEVIALVVCVAAQSLQPRQSHNTIMKRRANTPTTHLRLQRTSPYNTSSNNTIQLAPSPPHH